MIKNTNNYLKIGILALSIGCVALGIYLYNWEYRDPVLEMHFFSLTRGRSIFIRTPSSKTILVGGGQTSETIRELTKVMPFYERRIDYLVIPSAAPAQIGGLVEILDRYEIGEVVMPKIMATSTAFEALERKIRKQKIHVEEVERGEMIEIEDGVKATILFPYESFKFNKTSLPELGLSISYGSTTAYLLGNLSKTVQKDILKNMELPTTQNIVEFYHGATPAKVSPELLEKIDPYFTFSTKEKTTRVVSDGETWKREKRN